MKRGAYYNENNEHAAEWLRRLIARGLIADGEVDARSIVDVRPDDLRGFKQCHFFAGIGGWSLALRLAGWGDDREIWTGSCPCQPFSGIGKGDGFDDGRHLWPEWFRLIDAGRPSVVAGEQVASAVGFGWLDSVFDDLESRDYTARAFDIPACGVGAPHIRRRIWFVAGIDSDRMGDAGRTRLERLGRDGDDRDESGRNEPGAHRSIAAPGGATNWDDVEFRPGRDGKARPIRPGAFPLAYGIPGRVGRLRAYGNAIVPQVAAEMIGAYMDATR